MTNVLIGTLSFTFIFKLCTRIRIINKMSIFNNKHILLYICINKIYLNKNNYNV